MIIRKRFQLVALAVAAVIATTGFFLVSALSSSAESAGDAAILEKGGNINLGLRYAQRGKGPMLAGAPTAIYGKIMPYRDALQATGSSAAQMGSSQVWKLDRPVHVYVFEGEIYDIDPRTSNVTDWAQKIVIVDEEVGGAFEEVTTRSASMIDVSEFFPLSIRDDQKDVPPREIGSFNRPAPVPAEPATPAPPAPTKTPVPPAQ